MADPRGITESRFLAACADLRLTVVEKRDGTNRPTRVIALRAGEGFRFGALLMGESSDNFSFLNLFTYFKTSINRNQIHTVNRNVLFVKVLPDEDPDLVQVEYDIAALEMSQFQVALSIANFLSGCASSARKISELEGGR
jgi:hypothetical protein